jgi:hypothetical protein
MQPIWSLKPSLENKILGLDWDDLGQVGFFDIPESEINWFEKLPEEMKVRISRKCFQV